MPILRRGDHETGARYDEFVRASRHRTLTQDRAWARVKPGWGDEQVYLERDGEIVAAMSLLVRTVAGLSLLYAPRGPVCDLTDLDLVRALVQEARPLVRKHRAYLLKMDPEVATSPDLVAGLRDGGWTVHGSEADQHALIQPRMAMVLRLQGRTSETIMSAFKPKTRTLIRKCIKEGVHTTWGRDEETVRQFYDVYREMATRKGLPARDLDYFHHLRDAYPGARFYLAWHDSDLLATAVTIDYHGKLSYLYAGSRDLKRNLNANHLMNYDMIRWGIESGAESYDLGGVFALDPSDGLYVFKHAFCYADGPTEYVGEIDVVFNRAAAWAYDHGVPAVRSARRWAVGLPHRLRQRSDRLRRRSGRTRPGEVVAR